MNDATAASGGKYIVLEGPEGVGKTTQVLELARRLQAAGLPVRILREPDSQSDLTARAIRQLTQDPRYPMNTRTEVLLYNAARAQSLQVIKNSVQQGVICIVDRNYLTTLAIQYYGRGDVPDYDTITSIINFAVGGIEPDICIIMDASAATLKARAKSRGSGERFDNLDEAFLERVRAGYLWEAKHRNLPVVNADDSSSAVSEVIWRLVSNTLALNRRSSALDEMQSSTQAATSVVPALPAISTSADSLISAADQPLHAQSDATAHVGQPISHTQSRAQQSTEQIVSADAFSLDNSSSSESAIKQPPITSIAQDEDVPLLIKNKDGSHKITTAGRQYLQQVVTSNDSNVYAFTDKLSPITIAAAMARLSRRGDDMRVTILDEFANRLGKDEKLLQRVITAYGDDSVQQLAGLHIVVENASNLLTKKLEWGRLASYLEQSTRYIYYDQKDTRGNFKYYVPKQFSVDVKKDYKIHLDQIFNLYSKMVHKLTDYVADHSDVPSTDRDAAWRGAIRAQACDAVRPVLPVATTSTVGVFGSGQALENLIMHLSSDINQEAQLTGQKILKEVRKVMPILFERADKPDRGGATIAYLANTSSQVAALADQYMSETYPNGQPAAVTLVNVWPRNELDIVPDMLYEHSHLSLTEIQKAAQGWTYDQKSKVMQAYFGERLNRRHRPGRALEKIHYSWDLVCDYGIFRDLQRHRMVDDLEWQELTPRYGFEVPALIDEAGLTDDFEECFSISLKLHSLLQQAGYRHEAQYATLLGHKMRWKITYNAREAFHLHELRTGPQGHPGYRKLVLQMHQKLADVHPTIAEAMKFVNKGEDEALTRLAAERYTQFKLSKLQ